jgi:hypothetical protein
LTFQSLVDFSCVSQNLKVWRPPYPLFSRFTVLGYMFSQGRKIRVLPKNMDVC